MRSAWSSRTSGAVIAREAMNAFAALRASFVRAVDVDESRLALTTLPTLRDELADAAARRVPCEASAASRCARHRPATPRISTTAASMRPSAMATAAGLAARGQIAAQHLHAAVRAEVEDRCGGAGESQACAGACRCWAVPTGGPCGFARAASMRGRARDKFGTSLAHEYLDIAAAVAGHGIAIGSPLLFRAEIDAGRLVPAHDFVGTDGRAFWFTYPAARAAQPQARAVRRVDRGGGCVGARGGRELHPPGQVAA